MDKNHVNLLLSKGVADWNLWREKNPTIKPDLSGLDFTLYRSTIYRIWDAQTKRLDLHDVDFSDTNLARCNLSCADLSNASLRTSDLTSANLSGASIWYVDFYGASAEEANLSGVQGGGIELIRANLNRADLSSSKIVDSDFSEASCEGASFKDATLADSTFTKAYLHASDLSGAYLHGVDGLEVDRCRIGGTVFPPHANDQWSVLRRTYTGPNMFINLILLVGYFVPMLAKVAGLSAAQNAQEIVLATLEKFDQPEIIFACLDTLPDMASKAEHQILLNCESLPVWKILLGFGGPFGWLMPAFTFLILTYQLLRYMLTREVSLIRDAEDRSGETPPRGHADYPWTQEPFFVRLRRYPFLFRVHKYIQAVSWLALIALLLRAIEFLFLTNIVVQIS